MTTITAIEDPPIDIVTLSEEEKKELASADSVSSSDATLSVTDATFTAVKTLHINAKGISIWRISSPCTERSITITNNDGSLAYTSTRAKLSSGTCTLTDADGNSLIGTKYFFGPSKDPVLRRLDYDQGLGSDIKTLSKWTSRNHEFALQDGRTFEWRYKKHKAVATNGGKGSVLVLSTGDKTVAILVRNDETRTPGSKSCSAGNGGDLVLSEYVGGKMGLEEELVVATCLLMLKKEVDRRRCVQLMALGAVIM